MSTKILNKKIYMPLPDPPPILASHQFGIHMLAKFECGRQVAHNRRRNPEILRGFVTDRPFPFSGFQVFRSPF